MANLEDRVKLVEQRQNMEMGLNASRDRDLSELTVTVRSHTAMLQAVQERQAEHSATLAEHSHRLGRLEEAVDSLNTVVGSLNTVVGSLDTAVGSLRQITTDGFAALGGQLQLIINRESDQHG